MRSLPVTLRASRTKKAIHLLGSLFFVTGGIWMWPEEPLVGGLCVVFFGLAAIVFAIKLHPKSSTLTLTPEGLTMGNLFRKHFVSWSTVQSFTVAEIGANEMVGWNYASGFRDQAEKLRQLNVAMFDIEAFLPDTYGMKAEALCALLNELRETHGESAL